MLNRIIVMGRLTRDPELRRTQSGISVTSFSVAVDRDFKSQSGERETDFIEVVAWRNTAEFVTKYFSKGRMAVVEGRLQIRDWTDRDGQKRRTAEIVADNIYFGDSRRDSDSSGGTFGGAPGGSYGNGGYGGGNNSFGGGSGSFGGGNNSYGGGSGFSGGGNSSYGGAPGYGSAPAPSASPSGGNGSYGSAAPGYGSAPGYGAPSGQSDFAELGEDDGDLPF